MSRALAALLGASLLLAACGVGPAAAPRAGPTDPARPAKPSAGPAVAGDLGELSSEGGAIEVKASWVSTEPPVVKVTLDTHSVELDRFDLASVVRVRLDGGVWTAPTEIDAPPGGHHRSGSLTFGSVAAAAFGSARLIELRIADVGVPERLLRWERAR